DRRLPGRPPHPDVLTPAEWRVLDEVRRGRSNPEIAERLGLSLPTVKTHVSSMLAKLDLPDRHAPARWHGRPAAHEPAEAPSSARRRTTTAALALGGAAVAVAAVVLLVASMQGASAPGPGGEEPPALAGET